MALPSNGITSITVIEENIGIVSKKENGLIISRKRFTRSRKEFVVKYITLEETEKAAIIAQFEAVGVYLTFSWTNTDNDVAYTVRFKRPISWEANARIPNRWTFQDIELVEA